MNVRGRTQVEVFLGEGLLKYRNEELLRNEWRRRVKTRMVGGRR